jgi:hypothetical protein
MAAFKRLDFPPDAPLEHGYCGWPDELVDADNAYKASLDAIGDMLDGRIFMVDKMREKLVCAIDATDERQRLMAKHEPHCEKKGPIDG